MIIDLTNCCLCCYRIAPAREVEEPVRDGSTRMIKKKWSIFDQIDVIYNIAKNYIESTENLDYTVKKMEIIDLNVNMYKKHAELWKLFQDGKISIIKGTLSEEE